MGRQPSQPPRRLTSPAPSYRAGTRDFIFSAFSRRSSFISMIPPCATYEMLGINIFVGKNA